MDRVSLLCSAAAACAVAAGAASAQFSVGANVNITRTAGNQAEAAIAVNPLNTNNLFMCVNSSSANALQGAVSSNGGLTWTNRQMATGTDGLVTACCDGSAAFDTFGNLFVCYINASVTAVIVGLSTNNGASFTQIASFAGSVDQPTLTVGANTVWVTYNVTGTINARGAAITGLGTVGAFSAAQTTGSGNFGDICIGPAGQVAVTYQNPAGGQGASNLQFALDANGLTAGGFAAQSTITTTNVGGFDFIPAQNNRSVDSEAGFAWDRSGGTFNGRLYLVYTEEPVDESNNMEIRVRISNNNGSTWSAPTTVNTTGLTRSRFLPKIAMDQATGHVAVVWYDCRNDAANVKAELWGTASIDGGATWLPNVKISTGQSQSTTAASGIDFGDYIGLTMHNDTFWPIWADNANTTADNPNGALGAFDQYTARVTILIGSCCITGTCTRTVQAGCSGTWTLNGVCSPNPCAVVNGACCTAGTCSLTTQVACSGTWTSGGNCSPSLCPPSNDQCAGAPALSLGITATGSNVNATTDTTIVDTTICGQATAAAGTLDVFWQFTPSLTGIYTVDTCGSTFDTILTVHTACPATDTNKIACNDDSSINSICPSGGVQSRVPTVTLTAGVAYTVRVAGYLGATGSISITVTAISTTGACCIGPHCTTTTLAGCAGTFQGFTSACGVPANPTTCCPANYNGLNGIDIPDIFAFLSDWFAGAPGADFNHDTLINVPDIFNFLSAWFAGCS